MAETRDARLAPPSPFALGQPPKAKTPVPHSNLGQTPQGVLRRMERRAF